MVYLSEPVNNVAEWDYLDDQNIAMVTMCNDDSVWQSMVDDVNAA